MAFMPVCVIKGPKRELRLTKDSMTVDECCGIQRNMEAVFEVAEKDIGPWTEVQRQFTLKDVSDFLTPRFIRVRVLEEATNQGPNLTDEEPSTSTGKRSVFDVLMSVSRKYDYLPAKKRYVT